MAFLLEKKSVLNVEIPGTIGSFKVQRAGVEANAVEVKYILTHISLAKSSSQAQLFDMLAPVREVFDIKQLDFDEIMQRDIDDSRVSLDLIPYLLDASVSGQIKLFPPIVVVILPLKPMTKLPAEKYEAVVRNRLPFEQQPGYFIEKLTAGGIGSEQFEFQQYSNEQGVVVPDMARLMLSRDNCALAIVDGQHRAMALLALHRNLTGKWTDAKRAPYERYYKVWPEKEINAFDLSELQMPMIVCAFPQLDSGYSGDLDVIRAARRVFLTLNKNAKKVSDSRNRLLDDQDMVSECLRETLSHIKDLAEKDATALRIWNVELDQQGERAKVSSDVAFSGVSHLYAIAEHILLSADYVFGIENKSRVGAPKRKLNEAYERLGLKDEFTQKKRDANNRSNYSDEVKGAIRNRWAMRYIPIIDKIFGQFEPFVAFCRSTLWLKDELKGRHEPELESILFDGEGTARTFDEFREGLKRRSDEKEVGWTSPSISETLLRIDGLVKKRGELITETKARRAANLLGSVSGAGCRSIVSDGKVVLAVRSALDNIYENVFETVAFQTALVCTFTEACERAGLGADEVASELAGYLESLHGLFSPKSLGDVERLLQVFEGKLEVEPATRVVAGGPTFKAVVMSSEMQPSEWPKYRYLMIELWQPSGEKLAELLEKDRKSCRFAVSKALLSRRVKAYCDDRAISSEDITQDILLGIINKAKSDYESFLKNLGSKVPTLDQEAFLGTVAVRTVDVDGS